MYLDDCPDIKFSSSTFKEQFATYPELQKAFADAVYKLLSTYLSETRSVSVDDEALSIEAQFEEAFNNFGNVSIA